jgi:hypothetical protein
VAPSAAAAAAAALEGVGKESDADTAAWMEDTVDALAGSSSSSSSSSTEVLGGGETKGGGGGVRLGVGEA